MSLHENIYARNKLTALLSDDERPYGTLARDPAEKLFGWVYKDSNSATFDDCKAILDRVWVERGVEDGMTLLQRFGCGNLTDLFVGLYDRFFEYATISLNYGVSPQYGWKGRDDIPEEQRDRWLLRHPESDSLWEVRGKLSGELTDISVEDVSGILQYEKMFVEQSTSS